MDFGWILTLFISFIGPRYVFPLEEDAAVCGFEAKIGEKTVKGVVQDKMEARETYKFAVSNNKTAALLEKQSDAENSFSCEVREKEPQLINKNLS